MLSVPEPAATPPRIMVVPVLRVPPLLRFMMPMPTEPMVAPLLITREAGPFPEMFTVPLLWIDKPRVRLLAVSPGVMTSAVPPLLMTASFAAIGAPSGFQLVPVAQSSVASFQLLTCACALSAQRQSPASRGTRHLSFLRFLIERFLQPGPNLAA